MTVECDFAEIVRGALAEDHAENDLTTLACIPETAVATANLITKSPCVICGLPLLKELFPDEKVTVHVSEGERLVPFTEIATISGNTQTILSKERVLLNIMQLMTSVATKTAKFVALIAPNKCDILDTRKTLPGLRALQKYAVKIGGGKNHRFHLAQRIMIKDNHLAHCTIEEAIAKARARSPGIPIEVEVDTLEQLETVLSCNVESILLDNMSPRDVAKAVQMTGSAAYLEASGGINEASLADYAKTGVHGISIGALTHTIDAVDLSLNM